MKKRVIIDSDASIDEIVISSNAFDQESYDRFSLLVNCSLILLSKRYDFKILVNIDSQIYFAINEKMTNETCEFLDLESISLSRSRSMREFNEILSKKSITHVIYSFLIVNNHSKLTCSMLITQLNTHKIILEKL